MISELVHIRNDNSTPKLRRIFLLQKIFVKMQHRRKIICGMISYQNMKSDFKDKYKKNHFCANIDK